MSIVYIFDGGVEQESTCYLDWHGDGVSSFMFLITSPDVHVP